MKNQVNLNYLARCFFQNLKAMLKGLQEVTVHHVAMTAVMEDVVVMTAAMVVGETITDDQEEIKNKKQNRSEMSGFFMYFSST